MNEIGFQRGVFPGKGASRNTHFNRYVERFAEHIGYTVKPDIVELAAPLPVRATKW